MSEARADIPDRLQSGLPQPAAPDAVLPSPDVGAAPQGPDVKSPLPLDIRQTVMQKLVAAGATPQAAIGIGARIQDESGWNPEAIGDSGTSFGLFQHHNERAQRLMDFAAKQGKSPRDPIVQTDFAIAEMHGGDPQATMGAGSFMKATNPADAYKGFTKYFERPATLRDQWMGTAGLSPEARALVGMSQQHFAGFEQEAGRLRQQYERVAAAGPPDSSERRQLLADLRQQSHDMAQKWNDLVSRPPVEKPVDMLANFGSIATALVMLGGFAGKHHLNIALAAAGTMMQGINANNHQQFVQSYKRWEDQASMGLKMVDLQRQEIRDVLDDDKMARDEWRTRLETIFHESGMVQQLAATREGNDTRLFSIVAGLDKTANLARNQMEALKLQTVHSLKAKYLSDNVAAGMDQGSAEADANMRAMRDAGVSGAQTAAKGREDAINKAVDADVDKFKADNPGAPQADIDRARYESRLNHEREMGAAVRQPRSAPAMALQRYIEEYTDKNGRAPSASEIQDFSAQTSAKAAGQRTLETRSKTLELASNVADSLIPLVRATSEKINRTEYPRLNSIIVAAEKGTGNTDVIRFAEMVNALKYAYARALSPTGQARVADLANFENIVDVAWSKGQINAALDQIQQSIAVEKGAIAKTRQESGGAAGAQTAASPAASGYTPGMTKTYNGKLYTFTGGDPADKSNWRESPSGSVPVQ